MSRSIKLLLIHALSPIHCGTGQSVGGIDLPIAREKPTGIPLIPGATLKGVLRSGLAAEHDVALHKAVFGPDSRKQEDPSEHAGSVQFADATLLFLPVRSVRGTFAWVTSPYILRRFRRDAKEAGTRLMPPDIQPPEGTAFVTKEVLRVASLDNRVVFEDYDLESLENSELATFAKTIAEQIWRNGDDADQEHFIARVCVVHDDIMRHLLHTSLEITTRVRLDLDTKTVDGTALWTEEALPVETILAGLVLASPVRQSKPIGANARDRYTPKELLDHTKSLIGGLVQLGGNATVGRGLCRMRMVE